MACSASFTPSRRCDSPGGACCDCFCNPRQPFRLSVFCETKYPARLRVFRRPSGPPLPPVAGATAPEGHAVIASAISGNLSAFPYFARQNTRPGCASSDALRDPLTPSRRCDSPGGACCDFYRNGIICEIFLLYLEVC